MRKENPVGAVDRLISADSTDKASRSDPGLGCLYNGVDGCILCAMSEAHCNRRRPILRLQPELPFGLNIIIQSP